MICGTQFRMKPFSVYSRWPRLYGRRQFNSKDYGLDELNICVLCDGIGWSQSSALFDSISPVLNRERFLGLCVHSVCWFDDCLLDSRNQWLVGWLVVGARNSHWMDICSGGKADRHAARATSSRCHFVVQAVAASSCERQEWPRSTRYTLSKARDLRWECHLRIRLLQGIHFFTLGVFWEVMCG